MARIYAELIKKGLKTLKETPAGIRPQVKAILDNE